MLAEELINQNIAVLTPQDSVERALELMEDQQLEQLVLVENEAYVGILHQDMLLNWPDATNLLSQLYLPEKAVSVQLQQHVYELIEMANRYQLTVIPVVDEENLYLGTVVVNEMMVKFATLLGVQEPGAVVVLSMPNHQYSLTDISRLVESNNAKILSSYFAGGQYGMTDEATLTLKLNRTDVSAVVATFERFGYEVTGIFANQHMEHPDRQRLDMLMRYLET
jgi:acetoin utilization protein AcuB